jgi:hypothetical protein
MALDDHGSCKECGFDLNGERVYDYFLREHGGNRGEALAVASMYGCREGFGRFGKQVLVKTYTEQGKTRLNICPNCKEECY